MDRESLLKLEPERETEQSLIERGAEGRPSSAAATSGSLIERAEGRPSSAAATSGSLIEGSPSSATSGEQSAVGTNEEQVDGTDEDVAPLSRKVRRRRRRRDSPRSRTIAMKRLSKEEMRQGALLVPFMDFDRPATRSACAGGARPCPYVSCKHHLFLDVNPETGSIKLNFPHLEVWDMADTCSLDVAERGGITLEEVGEIMNLTRERIRQVEVRGLLKLKITAEAEGITPGGDG